MKKITPNFLVITVLAFLSNAASTTHTQLNISATTYITNGYKIPATNICTIYSSKVLC